MPWVRRPRGSTADAEAEGLGRMAAAVEASAEFVTEEKVQEYVDRFERLATEENRELMRQFVGSFVDHIDLEPPTEGHRKPRRVTIHGKAPGFARIELASPSTPSSNSWDAWIEPWSGLQGLLRGA